MVMTEQCRKVKRELGTWKIARRYSFLTLKWLGIGLYKDGNIIEVPSEWFTWMKSRKRKN
jgi:hypothetical protein